MQDNPSTDNTDNTDKQTPVFDMEHLDWELAFEPFEEHPDAAIKMGFNLTMLRQQLDGLLFKSRPVMEALDDAMQVLFPLTEFHDVSFNLFIKYMEGQLTFEEEEMLRALGVKF